MDEFQRIFEFEIRTKLSRRCQTKNEEIRQLYNSFHFYDFGSSSLIDKKGWIKGIQKIGLCEFNRLIRFIRPLRQKQIRLY